MKYSLYFDGLCEPVNPGGLGCYGFLILDEAEQEVAHGFGDIGNRFDENRPMTNNVAEYSALIKGLQKLSERQTLDPEISVRCFGDSKLVVEQVSGRWQIKQPHLQRAVNKAHSLLQEICGTAWVMEWIPRESNEAADALSRKAYFDFMGKQPPERHK